MEKEKTWDQFGFAQFQDENTIPWVLVAVTVVDVGASSKPAVDVFTVANWCACCCTPPLFDLSNLIVYLWICFSFKISFKKSLYSLDFEIFGFDKKDINWNKLYHLKCLDKRYQLKY